MIVSSMTVFPKTITLMESPTAKALFAATALVWNAIIPSNADLLTEFTVLLKFKVILTVLSSA